MDDRNGTGENPLSNPDIYGYDLLTRREFPICTLKGKQVYPRVSGHTVVWSDYRNVPKAKARTRAADPGIYGCDLATHRSFPICRAGGAQGAADISGDLVVWVDGRNRATSGADIHGYDLRTKRAFAVCTAPGDQQSPAVSGHQVVWTDYRRASPQAVTVGMSVGDVYLHDLSTGKTTRISPPGQGGTFATIAAQTVIWQQMGEHAKHGFYAYDLASKRVRFISTGNAMGRYSLSEGNVIWVEEEQSLTGSRFVVRGVRLHDGFRFVVTNDTWAGFLTSSGERVVWQNGPAGDAQLMLAQLRPPD
ncbi:MAG: hypothetical protein AB7V19_07560 [Candidatus Bipolaricaulia bacterium]